MPTERDEATYWKDQVVQRTRGELDTVRKAAAAWSALFTAVLGVFGTVTFAGGLTALDDLPSAWQPWVKGATILAAAATLIAIVFASSASGTMPEPTNDTTWEGLRTTSESAAQTALTQLHRAKVAGLGAAVLVLAGSAAVLLVDPSSPAASAPTLIAVIDGQAICGTLTVGPPLSIGTTPLTHVTSLTVVPRCSP